MADRYTRRINLYINDKEVRNDISSIRKEMTKATAAQNKMIIGSKEYVAQGKKVALLKGIIAKHQADIRKTTQSWSGLSRAVDKVNRYMGATMAAAAAIMAVIMGLRKAAEAAMLFEERLDNLSALTGLEGRQLLWLGQQAKDASVSVTDSGVRIKQAASDIVDAYTKVGSQRPELLRNKEALDHVTKSAIILSEAAKMDLEPAVKGLAMSMNQHNLGATHATRIINAMAAGSKLGAANIPYLTQAIEKSGTTLNIMNLSLEDNVALIEAIAPSFSEAASAGTSLDRTFLKMRAMNIGYKDGVFDVNRALEELRFRFANGEQAVDLFGLRHAKMAEILVKNRSEFQRYRAGVTGTNIAFEQAVKNTDNTATKLQQARNKLTLALMEFGETINPVFLKSTNLMNYLIKGLVLMPKFIRDNQIVLISLASALLAYNAALVQSIALSIQANIIRAATAVREAALVTVATLRVATTKIELMFMRQQTAAQVAYAAQLKKSIAMQQLWGKALMANPVGMVIAALGLLVVAIKSYDKYSEQAQERERKKTESLKNLATANEAYAEHLARVNTTLESANKYSREHKEALAEEIKEIIAATEAQILFQKAKQVDLAVQNSQATLWQRSLNIFKAGGNAALAATYDAVDAAKNGAEAAGIMTDGLNDLEDKLISFKQNDVSLYEILNAEKIGDEIGVGTLSELEEKLSAYQTAVKNLKVGTEEYNRVQKKILDTENIIASARGKSALTEKERIKKEIDNLQAFHNLQLAEIKRQHLEGFTSEDVYNDRLLKAEIQFQQMKMKIYKKGSEDYAKAYNKSLSLEVDAQTKVEELFLKAENVLADARIANFQDGLDKELALQERAWEKEKQNLEKQLIEKGELSATEIALNDAINQTIEEKEAEHQLKLAKIREAANIGDLEAMVEATAPIDENLIELEALKEHLQAKQNLIEAQYEIDKKLAGDNQAALLAAEKKYNQKSYQNKVELIHAEAELKQTKLDIANDYLSALAGVFSQESAMGKALFVFQQGLAVAEVWLNVAKANAIATAASPLTFGMPWVANNTRMGVMNTALIVAQTVGRLAKFADGGYTAGERMYIAGEAGTEWIAPNWMMDNPATAAVIASLENLRTNKVNVNATAIPKFSNGGLSNQSTTLPTDNSQNDLKEEQYHKILKDLTTEIKELRKYRPAVSVELIEKELNNLNNIKVNSGL